MKIFSKTLACLFLLVVVGLALQRATAVSAPAGNPSTITVKMDSAHLLMGKTSPIHVTIVSDRDGAGRLLIPADSLTSEIEVHSVTTPDTSDIGGGRMQIDYDVFIQAFDSGDYVIPPLHFLNAPGDTLSSEQLALKVIPCNVDTMTTIHDFAPVMTIEPHFWDFLPDWVTDNWVLIVCILAAVLLAVAGLILYLRFRKKGAKMPSIVPRRKPTPPHVVALRALQELQEDDLPAKGMDKEFYTRLTEILRRYIDARFNINAMEMTSPQILKALRSTDDARLSEAYMRRILEIADYVKFARLRPFSDDNVKAFSDAVQFVEDTKPVPVPQAAESQSSIAATSGEAAPKESDKNTTIKK